MRLTDAVTNTKYVITGLHFDENIDAGRYYALGFVPGAEITLIQNAPYRICSLGGGKIALSDTVAGMISINQ